MYLIEVRHKFGKSYLGMFEDKPVLCCLAKATKFVSDKEAIDATCWLQEIQNWNEKGCSPPEIKEI